MPDQPLNQTEFAANEPLFEQRQQVEPKPDKNNSASTIDDQVSPGSSHKKSFLKKLWPEKLWKKMAVVGGAVFILLLVITLVLAIFNRPGTGGPILQTEKEKIDEQAIITPFKQRLNEIQGELEQSDPAQEELPFPPVNMEIRL